MRPKDQAKEYPFKRVAPDLKTGLSRAQVDERMAAGAHNAPMPTLTRSTMGIIRDHVFTLFNFINAALAVLIMMVGRHDNLLFMGVVLSNIFIGIFQELRAKRSIDRLSILTEAKATVVRDGVETVLDAASLVLDDIMRVSAGKQILADGRVMHGEGLEVDESALTGESVPVLKKQGDRVLSGSIAVAGHAWVQVESVGAEGFAWKLSSEARRKKKPSSELMRSLNAIIRVLTVVIIPLGVALFMTQQHKGMGLEASLLGSAAAMLGMIPEGLVLLTGVAFAAGAFQLARRKALVQSMPCIETLARVDTLCLDKTGTITDGSFHVCEIAPCGAFTAEDVDEAVSALMRALKDDNATAAALRTRFTADPGWRVLELSPFSSARKWSGCAFADKGAYRLGAPEFLDVTPDDNQRGIIAGFLAKEYRVMALTHTDGERLDAQSASLAAILALCDHIRPEAEETLAFFKREGVALKIISGDNAETVASVAQRAGVESADNYVDMSAVKGDAAYGELCERTTVFGRVSPHQKQALIRALQQKGHVVAMTGDGVNDVLALKDADCSVAMASGNDAARDVSDIVLLTSDFGAMTHAVMEGRRVVNNIERVASLFLVKTIYSVLLTVLFIFLPIRFPFEPIQLTPVSMLTVGIPSFFLALTPSFERLRGRFLRNVLKISLPGAFAILINIFAVMLVSPLMALNHEQASTLCVLMAGVVGFIVLGYAARPLDAWRKTLVIGLPIVFCAVYVFFGSFFSLEPMSWPMAVVFAPLLFLAYPLFRLLSYTSLRLVRFVRMLAGKKTTR